MRNRPLLVVALRQANLSAKANQNQETSAASQINFPSRTGRFGTGFQQLRSEKTKERKQYVYPSLVLYLDCNIKIHFKIFAPDLSATKLNLAILLCLLCRK